MCPCRPNSIRSRQASCSSKRVPQLYLSNQHACKHLCRYSHLLKLVPALRALTHLTISCVQPEEGPNTDRYALTNCAWAGHHRNPAMPLLFAQLRLFSNGRLA